MPVEIYNQFEAKHWVKGADLPSNFPAEKSFKDLRDLVADKISDPVRGELQGHILTYSKELYPVAMAEGHGTGKTEGDGIGYIRGKEEANDAGDGTENKGEGKTGSRIGWFSFGGVAISAVGLIIMYMIMHKQVRHWQAAYQQSQNSQNGNGQ